MVHIESLFVGLVKTAGNMMSFFNSINIRSLPVFVFAVLLVSGCFRSDSTNHDGGTPVSENTVVGGNIPDVDNLTAQSGVLINFDITVPAYHSG